MRSQDDDAEVCSICGQEVKFGQPRHSLTGNHWDCMPKVEDVRDVIKRMDDAMTGLCEMAGIPKAKKPPVRAGTGPTTEKVKAKIIAALEKEYGCPITDVVIWVQPPAYRGPRWDLAGWGGTAKAGQISLTFQSWNTMTACAKGETLEVGPDNMTTHGWDISPERKPKA
ncbi:hypothetical protein HNP46_000407 [Pseudomonas nitritireducens]|uniref:Uncharacterized protein n=1 Tax=Pseudomonas nitroreducens TaxID=46680 RepID=A0A7W7KEX4_PSENT|nr:hypothetical protein [Pseudomonas nitritireducens]MBB4861596.1 hypothetical protein [Pseudomonas nitritireducens]